MNYFLLKFQLNFLLKLAASSDKFLKKIGINSLGAVKALLKRVNNFNLKTATNAEKQWYFKSVFVARFVSKTFIFFSTLYSKVKVFENLLSTPISNFNVPQVGTKALKKRNLNIKNFNLKNRVDITLRLLAPSVKFFTLKKNYFNFNFFFSSYLVWPGECLDILVLIFKSNPFFINTKLLDSSIFFSNYKGAFTKVMYYIFKIPLFSTLLVVFFNLTSSLSSFSKKLKVISLESAFKSMSWIERESSELFGFFFFGKKNNRKLVTDYFLKIYPMLKWVPSVGFSELAISAEGVFILRSVRVQNLSLA